MILLFNCLLCDPHGMANMQSLNGFKNIKKTLFHFVLMNLTLVLRLISCTKYKQNYHLYFLQISLLLVDSNAIS